MKKLLKSLPFVFIFGLLIWVVNSLVASMFIPGKFTFDSRLFSLTLENIYTRIMIVSFSILLYMILFRIFVYEREQKLLRKAFNHSFPMCVTDFHYNIIQANDTYWELFGKERNNRKKCYTSRPGESCHTESCLLKQIRNGAAEVIVEHGKKINGELRCYIVKARPFFNTSGEMIGIIESYNDITERKKLEQEKEHLISELRDSLEHVNVLKGMLPICPSCKQVRDDKGYWEQIDAYLNEKSEAEVTPCLCPDCREQTLLCVDDLEEYEHEHLARRTSDMQWLKLAN